MTKARIPFTRLTPREDGAPIRAAIDPVIARGWFVLGPEVEAFEAEFAEAMGAACAVGVGSGTDAIALTLRALGISPGDEVVTTPLSAAYSALAVVAAGACGEILSLPLYPGLSDQDADTVAAAVKTSGVFSRKT